MDVAGTSSGIARVEVNSPPQAGYTEVSPTVGIAYDTEFSMAAVNWVDGDQRDLPLRFSFGFLPCAYYPVC